MIEVDSVKPVAGHLLISDFAARARFVRLCRVHRRELGEALECPAGHSLAISGTWLVVNVATGERLATATRHKVTLEPGLVRALAELLGSLTSAQVDARRLAQPASSRRVA